MAGGTKSRSKPKPSGPGAGIKRLSVRGYKSLADQGSMEIRPLTILAGPNSAGKSSIMQPLLLMKQTLEASFDPGALLLDGPNLSFTKAEQLLSRLENGKHAKSFVVRFESEEGMELELEFANTPTMGFEIARSKYRSPYGSHEITPRMTASEIRRRIQAPGLNPANEWTVTRVRCFLRVVPKDPSRTSSDPSLYSFIPFPFNFGAEHHFIDLIHVPSFRGNPRRSYPAAPVGIRFPGTFEPYCAGIVAQWEAERAVQLNVLGSDLARLGLTSKISAAAINETEWELRVGRLPVGVADRAADLVNIADVGFGVSQTLPVLLALLVARPGQLVFIEQPEVHLHPRAQTALAEILAEAAKRGVRVVVETHSDLLLLGVQTLVAKGELPADSVKLHWFQRSSSGVTRITSADLDEDGSFGRWPEDFTDVRLDSQSQFLDAAESKAGTCPRCVPHAPVRKKRSVRRPASRAPEGARRTRAGGRPRRRGAPGGRSMTVTAEWCPPSAC